MNHLIGKMVENQCERKNQQSRINKKTTITKEMGLDFDNLSKQCDQNNKKIQELREQSQQYNDKLLSLNNTDTKINQTRKKAQIQLKIKQLKQQLGRIRKNKFWRQKQILKGNDKQREDLQDLQQQTLNYTKKQEMLLSRLQSIHQQLADSDYSILKQKDYFQELKNQCLMLEELQENSKIVNSEHMELIYKNHRRKLQLCVKRNERDEETKKRKYYNLLLQFQNLKTKLEETRNKIYIAEQANIHTLNHIQDILQKIKTAKIKNQTRKSLHYPGTANNNQNQTNFLLTQLKDNRRSISNYHTEIKLTLQQNKLLIMQKKLNKINGSGNQQNRSFVRIWNKLAKGSIVRQVQTPINGQSSAGTDRDHQYSGLRTEEEEREIKQRISRIKHFKTQVSPHIQQEILSESFMDYPQNQRYAEDFEQ